MDVLAKRHAMYDRFKPKQVLSTVSGSRKKDLPASAMTQQLPESPTDTAVEDNPKRLRLELKTEDKETAGTSSTPRYRRTKMRIRTSFGRRYNQSGDYS